MFHHRTSSHRTAALVLALITALLFAGAVPAPVAAAPDPWSYQLPGYDPEQPLPTPFTYPSFTYESAFRLLEFGKEPAPALDDLEELLAVDRYAYGTYENMLASWRDNYRQKRGDAGWKAFVKGYVQGVDANSRGKGYEGLVIRVEGMSPRDYLFDQAPPGAPTRKQPDAFPRQQGVGKPGSEMKDSRTLSARAQEQLEGYIANVDALNTPMVYYFRERPTPGTLLKIKNANARTQVNQARAKAGQPLVPAIVSRQLAAIPQRVPQKDPVADAALLKLWQKRFAEANGGTVKWTGAPPMSPDDGTLTAPSGQIPVDGPLSDGVQQSADTPEEAAAERQVVEDLGTRLDNPDLGGEADLGGVDFSTLELRYVSDSYHNGASVQYAFQAGKLTGEAQSYGGRRAARLASDSFFVWLELPPSAFTVNLNPDEPDRIIDATFGRTDAGRVLLEADLAMKKSVAKFIHPDSPAGQKYWDALQGDTKCLSMRQWIVPATATVRENDDELFILDAPLEVKMESERFKAQGAAGGACDAQQDEATTKHNEEVYRTTILPQVQQAVNTAPEYADLRRVYASRVAAEWFRQRSATKHTAYSDLIGKGDITRWASQEKWTPREVFDRYVQSYRQGEFNITRQTSDGSYLYTNTYVYGGVDFSRINRNTVSADAFTQAHPTLPTSVNAALYAPSGDGREVWLGGLTTSKPVAEAFARPEPATSKPLFYPLLALPLLAWLAAGAWLLRRRSRPATAGA